MVNGVPVIAWPLHAEQKMDATLLKEEFQVAIRPVKLQSTKMVRRRDTEIMLRKIMEKEREAIRAKVKKLKSSTEKACNKGGSFYNSLSNVTEECKNRHHRFKSKALGA